MARPKLDISRLTPEERLRLIGDLWDSLDDRSGLALSEALADELEDRVAEAEKDPGGGRSWESIKKELLEREG
jgi:putative addiction module component (TIGR02574 family)